MQVNIITLALVYYHRGRHTADNQTLLYIVCGYDTNCPIVS